MISTLLMNTSSLSLLYTFDFIDLSDSRTFNHLFGLAYFIHEISNIRLNIEDTLFDIIS